MSPWLSPVLEEAKGALVLGQESMRYSNQAGRCCVQGSCYLFSWVLSLLSLPGSKANTRCAELQSAAEESGLTVEHPLLARLRLLLS